MHREPFGDYCNPGSDLNAEASNASFEAPALEGICPHPSTRRFGRYRLGQPARDGDWRITGSQERIVAPEHLTDELSFWAFSERRPKDHNQTLPVYLFHRRFTLRSSTRRPFGIMRARLWSFPHRMEPT